MAIPDTYTVKAQIYPIILIVTLPALSVAVERSNGTTDARALVRELKAVGGDLRALRRALTGRDRGPELWTVIAALPREEALRRIDAAL